MNEKICYLIGAGEVEKLDFVPKPNDLVIAVDGGFLHAQKANIVANFIVGDFDSLCEIPNALDNITKENQNNFNIVKLDPVKDFTDMQKAIELGEEAGFDLFYIYGGLGGRTSHTLANIGLLTDLAKRGKQGYLVGENEVLTVISDKTQKFVNGKGFMSAFAIGCESVTVTEVGFKYPLDSYILKSTSTIGTSNEFSARESCVTAKNGCLLLILEQKK